MLEIFAEEGDKLQNVYAPLPLGFHIVFCLIATALYLVLFQRRKSYNYLCLLLAVDLTILPQFFTQSAVIGTLFFVEVVLLIASAVFSYKESKKKKLQKLSGIKVFGEDAEQEPSEDSGDE